jgi:hypothetical protein
MTRYRMRFLLFLAHMTLLILAGCGDNQSTPTGSATFKLQWEKPETSVAKTVGAAAADICSDYGVQTITASFIDGNGTAQASGSFACSAHQGVVSGIPAASNYKVRIEGMPATGSSVVWRGEKTGVVIAANTDNPVGTVTMNYVGSTDTTAPTIAGSTPASGSSSVPVSSPMNITFSEPMAPSTINGTTVTLSSLGGEQVAGTISYDTATWRATFTSDAPLANGTSYRLTVNTGAKDQSGKGLSVPYTCDFTTVAAAAVVHSKAILKLSALGAGAILINGVEITMTLPAGVTLAADASGIPNTGAVAVSGGVPSGASMTAKYIPAAGTTPGKVTLSIASTTGFWTGEFVTITADIASGTVPVAPQFILSDFTAFDNFGAAVSGINATVGLELL